MRPRRVPFTVSATMLFLVVTFNSTPSDTAIPDPYRIPNPPQESQAIQDLAKWVVQSRGERPGIVTQGDLDAALTEKPQKLGLLSPEADNIADAARREQLVGLPYGPEIWRIAQRRGVDSLLVASIVQVESRFAHNAVSPRGAVGLMQVLPSTGELYGAADLNDPHVNLDVGCRYLGRLLKDFDGDVERAVAAYNAGPATVVRYNGVPPFRETREYVRRVLGLYRERSDAAWERAGAGRDPFAPLRADS
jgi:soluble lytic murein transglycosylase-like protein